MNLTITPTLLHGSITPPPSKSQAHRLILCAALAEGESVIENVALSQDIQATLRCMEALGAAWTLEGKTLHVRGIGGPAPFAPAGGDLPFFDCGESGSTLRFLIPIALAVAGGGVFTGRGRLMERPQKPYFDLFDEKGIFYEREGDALTVRGRLAPGEYRLAGNVSSQFFTGLLYALPLLEGDSTVISTTALESVGYITMTRQAMEQFGVVSRWEDLAFHVPGGQAFRAGNAEVEADWSQAAFWYAAAEIGNAVTVTGMNHRSIQLDRLIVDYAGMIRGDPLSGPKAAAGSVYKLSDGEEPSLPVPRENIPAGHSVGLDVRDCPDLVPPLAAMGAFMNGELRLKNAGRLRLKESDRLAAVTAALGALGAGITEEADRLVIQGRESLPGGVRIDCCNDHRIAMMAAVAATRCREPVTLIGAQCVAKSYPNFWEDYRMLGGIIREHLGE